MVRKLSEAMNDPASSNVDPTTIQACLAEYTRGDTEIKRLAQQQAAMLKRYEGQGVNVKSIKVAHKAGRLDKAAARAQVQSDTRYLIVTGILNPADDDWTRQISQSSLFESDGKADAIGKVSPDLARARAHNDGYNSGRHGGEAINNPWQPGQLEHASWEQGRRDGAEDRTMRGKGAKVADTKPRKPVGRPRKTVVEEPAEADA